MTTSDELNKAVAVIDDKFYFIAITREGALKQSRLATANLTFSIDNELTYDSFFSDFGPLDLGKTYRFCEKTQRLLAAAQGKLKRLYFYTCGSCEFRANVAVLVGFYQIVFLRKSAEEAHESLKKFEPYPFFRDPSFNPQLFRLLLLHILKGIERARSVNLIDWKFNGHLIYSKNFSIEEYEMLEQPERGDLNWIVPNKIAALAGPQSRRTGSNGDRFLIPEDYHKYFRSKKISAIIRLNNKVYDKTRFTSAGIKVYELFFPDGSCPTQQIITSFVEICKSELEEGGAVAVHCKAGLGRTGILICCYLIMRYGFKAEEALGYIRICRPGSVIGHQQTFLKEIEPFLLNLNKSRSFSNTSNKESEKGKLPMTYLLTPKIGSDSNKSVLLDKAVEAALDNLNINTISLHLPRRSQRPLTATRSQDLFSKRNSLLERSTCKRQQDMLMMCWAEGNSQRQSLTRAVSSYGTRSTSFSINTVLRRPASSKKESINHTSSSGRGLAENGQPSKYCSPKPRTALSLMQKIKDKN